LCGRFTLFASADEIVRRFRVRNPVPDDYVPRYNIAPTQPVLAVINDGKENRIGYLRWGLIPSWAKDAKMGSKLINARAETLTEKPSFRDAVRHRRCLIVADGFYEWAHTEHGKQPMRIQRKDGGLFAMAGLWERWRSPDGRWVYTCAIVTTEANERLRAIHPRMPVILAEEDEATWLDPSFVDAAHWQPLLKPFPADALVAYPVSPKVNQASYDAPELIRPWDDGHTAPDNALAAEPTEPATEWVLNQTFGRTGPESGS